MRDMEKIKSATHALVISICLYGHAYVCVCMFVPAVFAYSKSPDPGAMLSAPHLQDAPAGGINHQELSTAAGHGGGSGYVSVSTSLTYLHPAQLGVTVTYTHTHTHARPKLNHKQELTQNKLCLTLPLSLSLSLAHPSTCGWRCRAPCPAVSLCQSRPSLLPWCYTATGRRTRHDVGNPGDRTWEKQRPTLSNKNSALSVCNRLSDGAVVFFSCCF